MSGYGRTSLLGIEIHQEVQARRAAAYSHYRSEVKTGATFERGGYRFVVEGRIDGVFDPREDEGEDAVPKIEEIKSTFNVDELQRVMMLKELKHPYYLQLLTYGYFHRKETGVVPELAFHLVSTRNKQTLDYEIKLKVDEYEAWLDLRLDELVEEADLAVARAKRRRKIVKKFPFPFENPRMGQVELMETVEKAQADHKRLMVQAPTGLGKTAGVLYPSLKESLARGQRTIYVTPKNSQHLVAEDAIERFQETGAAVKSLTITAKSKMCMKAEPLCNPKYCEYAKDHYDKLGRHEIPAQLAKKKKKLTARVFKKFATDYEVCPYELQFEAMTEADVTIGDYHYVFSSSAALAGSGNLQVEGHGQEGLPNLVIDEAHNLPSRAMGYYSPALSAYVLNRMRDDVRRLPKKFVREVETLLDECIQVVRDCAPKDLGSKTVPIDPPVAPFEEQEQKLRGFLSKYLDSDHEIEQRDPVLALCFYWSEFTRVLEEISGEDRPEFFVTYQPGMETRSRLPTIKITCCDASEILKPNYDEYENVVAFSATLKPFEYYSLLSGLRGERLQTAEFQSPFESKNRKLLVIPQISTKYTDRARNVGRIAETVAKIVAVKLGNYFVFFPSFEFLEQTLNAFVLPTGFQVVRQERYMKNAEVEEILDNLRDSLFPTLVFAVQGGVFSEGVDYPGNMIIGAFIVGPPLPTFDVEREKMRDYYEQNYRSGFDYAYTYPAMAKAIQAAGRVIRSETDRGIIVFLDNRFLDRSYSKSMPSDWFNETPMEMVSSSILRDVQSFWAE